MKKLMLTALLCVLTPFAMAAGDAKAGKSKAAVCAACHAADGNSLVPNFPRIAGQHPSYAVKQLKDIKSGLRAVPEMTPFVMNMSEEDMADIAAYYASQTPQGGTTKADLLAKGESIYRAGNQKKGVA